MALIANKNKYRNYLQDQTNCLLFLTPDAPLSIKGGPKAVAKAVRAVNSFFKGAY